MKYLLFGTGDYYNRYKKWFAKKDILALLDNSEKKQQKLIDGILVLPPEKGIKLSYDVIVILSFYVKEMRRQLVQMGVLEDKIFHFNDLHWLLEKEKIKRPIQFYGNIKKKAIFVLSQDLTLGGPAIALFHAAEILAENGCQVVYVSIMDGPLREQITRAGIPVIVDENLQIETMSEVGWIGEGALIICNTISFYVFLSDRNTDIPVIWWLHDSSFFYDGVNKRILKEIDQKRLSIVSVGSVPQKAFQDLVPDVSVGELLYGVEDNSDRERAIKKDEGHIFFVTIGYIEKRKGQDVLVKAVQSLPQKLRENTKFYFVGQDSSYLAQQIKAQIGKMPEFVLTGPVNREKIRELLQKADVLICPSREDPMPTVCAEAMMHEVPCLVSDAVGTAGYLTEYKDGLIFESENVDELREKIEWCIMHRQSLREMGQHARKLYENIFSLKVFGDNLMQLVNHVMKDVEEIGS